MSFPKGRKIPNFSKILVSAAVSLIKISLCASDTEGRFINPNWVPLSDLWCQDKIDRWKLSDLVQTSHFGRMMFCHKWPGKLQREWHGFHACFIYPKISHELIQNNRNRAAAVVVVRKINIYMYICILVNTVVVVVIMQINTYMHICSLVNTY